MSRIAAHRGGVVHLVRQATTPARPFRERLRSVWAHFSGSERPHAFQVRERPAPGRAVSRTKTGVGRSLAAMTTVFYDDQGRPEPPFAAGEAATLLGFLDFLRATIEWKTADLDTAALHRRLPAHPSAMTLGGLLKHLAFVEFWWFEAVALGEPTSAPWVGADFDADPDWDWHSAAQDSAADLRALWQGQVERSRQIVVDLLAADGDDGAAALARAHRIREGRDPVSLRWILTHMIEEYGRHAGHADLLREGIDGQAGE